MTVAALEWRPLQVMQVADLPKNRSSGSKQGNDGKREVRARGVQGGAADAIRSQQPAAGIPRSFTSRECYSVVSWVDGLE